MHKVNGGCHCGNIVAELGLPHAPDTYNPRACDCDFCRKHCASYVSDPKGSLLIRIKDEQNAGRYRQGSGTAELLFCRNCGVLVSVLYRNEGQLFGAVNSKAVEGPSPFGAEQTVSPKTLSPDRKVKRWQDIWFADVRVVSV